MCSILAAAMALSMKKRLLWAAFFLTQLVATLLLVEGALRLLRPHHEGLKALLYIPSQRTVYDKIDSVELLLEETILGFVPYQNRRGFVLNSHSFRTPEYTGRKEPGAYRILCLGDSFTFASGGVPFEYSWPAQLESELNRFMDRPAKVFSLGVPGVGPRFELRLWELEHRLVRADHVILAFFVGNDFIDERDHGMEPWIETRPARLSYTWRLLRNLYRLWGESRSAHRWLLDMSDQEAHTRGGFATPMEPHEIGPPQSDPARYLEIETRRLQICVKGKREEFLQISAEVADTLRRLAAGVRSSGASLTVMIIPDEYQVNPELLRKVLTHSGLRAQDTELDFPQRRLCQLLEELEIPYLDLLPTFGERSAEQVLYWPNDSHWNIEGNILAGGLLAAHLRQDLLPGRAASDDSPTAVQSPDRE